MLRWYLIHTKPSGEMLALANLQRQGYAVYLPRLLQHVRRGSRRYARVGPLFPRYLFLRLREGQQPLAPVTFTVGVAGIVRFGSRYAVVPDEVIRDLRGRADPASGLHSLLEQGCLTPGAAVRITEGPFDGLEGIFQRQAGAERVIILLSLLGRSAPVCVRADSVVLQSA